MTTTVKRSAPLSTGGQVLLIAAGAGLTGASYGLVRLAYGLYLPDVQAELGLDTDTAGFVSGGSSIVFCVAAALGLLLAVKHPKLLVIGAALTAGLGALGLAFSVDAGMFAVFAVISSAGAGFASPVMVSVLQRNIRSETVGQAQMIVNAGTGPGLALTGILALLLLPDWRLAWGIAGVFTVIVAAIVLVLDGDREPRAQVTRQAGLSTRWLRAHGWLILASILLGIGTGVVWTYGRSLLVDAGADDVVSVLAWMALGVGGAAVIVTARWMAGLRPRTTWVLSLSAVTVATAGMALVPTNAVLALLAFVVFGWGYIASAGAVIVWTTQIDAARAPAGTALLFIVIVFGQAVGASLAGIIVVGSGYLVTFLIAAVVSLAAAAVVYLQRSE